MKAHELFAAHVELVTTDAAKWRALWADDAVMELPYVSSIGMQDKYVGLDAVYKFMQETIVSQFADAAVSNLRIQQIAGSDSCVGEYELRATLKSTGKVYNPKYVILLTAKDGKIIHLKEYVNPLSITAAFN